MPLRSLRHRADPGPHARNEPVRLCLHLGVHKTATTHLQAGLGEASDTLQAAGIAYLGPEAVRSGKGGIHGAVAFGLPGAVVRHRFEGAVGLSRTVLISDENLLGTMEANFVTEGDAGLYLDAPARVGRLIGALRHPRAALFLGLRHPADYLLSCYRFQLRQRGFVPWSRYAAKVRLRDISWLALVKALAAVPGVGSVTLWRAEDWPAVAPRVLRAMLGPGHPAVPLPQGRVNAGWQSGDIVQAYALAGCPPDFSGPGFRPLSDAAWLRSSQRYGRELGRLARLPKVTVLYPGGPEA